MNVALGRPASISNRSITIANPATGTLHYVFVRAHDAAGNWGAWSQVPLTVTNPLSPFAEPVLVDPILAGTALPLTAPVARGIADVAVTATGPARLVKVISAHRGSVRARFVFTPHGVKLRGAKTIVKARDKAHHTVLSVQVRGDAKHGYHMRASSGHKHSAWISLENRRAVLEAAVLLGKRPTLNRAH